MNVKTNLKAGLLQGKPVRSSCKTIGSILLFLVIAALPSQAQSWCSGSENRINTQLFDGPTGSTLTEARGINNRGCIVGAFQYPYNPTNGSPWHSFFRVPGGGSQGFDYPNAAYTEAYKINNYGNIVGSFRPSWGSPDPGFVWNGTYQPPINFPGSILTEARGINDSGTIVGRFAFTAGTSHGFSRAPDGTMNQLDYAGPLIGTLLTTELNAINNSGISVGLFQDSGVLIPGGARPAVQGFFLNGSIWSPIFPTGTVVTNGNLTVTVIDVVPMGINDSGVIAGYFTGSDNAYHGFFFNPCIPGLGEPRPNIACGGRWTDVGSETRFYGINNDGVMVGRSTDAQGTHGLRLEIPALMIEPTPGSPLSSYNPVTFTWTEGGTASVTQYFLFVGRSLGSNDISSLPVNAPFFRVLFDRWANISIPAATRSNSIYVRLWSLFAGIWQYRDYVYQEVGPAADMTSPTPGIGLSGSSVSFSWSSGTGTQYYLRVSRSPGGTDFFDGFATQSATVNNLPIDGSKVYVQLYSWINGAWQWRDYIY